MHFDDDVNLALREQRILTFRHCCFDTGEPSSERPYIKDEVQKLVRKNKALKDAERIAEKVLEFETRIVTGVHYKIPYPRPVNVAPGSTGKDPQTVTPVYLHSYKQEGGSGSSTRRKTNVPVYED